MPIGGEIRGWSLHQPWTSLVAHGLKKIETRGKAHPYRGFVAIHASKPWGVEQRQALTDLTDTFPATFGDAWPWVSMVPLGAFVAVGRITSCEVMTQELIDAQTPLERACGDWRRGRFAFRLADVCPLATPLPAAGKQGLWRLDLSKLPEIEAAVAQLL